MPESRRRKKKKASSAPGPAAVRPTRKKGQSPAWYGAAILVCLILAVVWLIGYTMGPIPGQGALGSWNYAIAFGLLIVGVGLLTNWR